MRRIVPSLIAAFALLAACAPRAAPPPETIRIVGYNDMDEMLGALTDAYARHRPGTRFELELKSTKSAPGALLSGASQLAPMGAAMSAAERAAIRTRWGHDPVEIRVAHDSLKPGVLSSPTGVFIHRDNPLRAIRLSDLRRLFTPHADPITRWSQLGGADRAVTLLSLGDQTAIGKFLLDGALRSDRFVPAMRGFPQSREVAAAIGADRNAIGFANLNHANPAIRALDLIDDRGRRSQPIETDIVAGRYPLDRHLLVYARRGRDGQVEPAARDFLAYMLSAEGQTIIGRGEKAYLPLNPADRRYELKKLFTSMR